MDKKVNVYNIVKTQSLAKTFELDKKVIKAVSYALYDYMDQLEKLKKEIDEKSVSDQIAKSCLSKLKQGMNRIQSDLLSLTILAGDFSQAQDPIELEILKEAYK